ncbi:type II toxin-antitoxin system VapC family toxin [Metallosphaera javensis (ex Sakai et al. 2022)]|uniref:type II toxin-antitoxin system VapC family toxin n=1 Tax=Metallosphaera javensis (ex Sakai et al. 2022) TaxID=2775498 RepID=UPI002584EE61|nr:MAG: PIN domain nuclease [Metallosphaera javensis (ex Sakai et al. 2022)]
MKESYVIDAGVVSLFPGLVKRCFEDMVGNRVRLVTSELTPAGFIFHYARRFGKDVALARYRSLRNSPLEVISPDSWITETAGVLKASHGERLSLADCFLVATAMKVKGTVLTTDSGIRDVYGRVIKIEY